MKWSLTLIAALCSTPIVTLGQQNNLIEIEPKQEAGAFVQVLTSSDIIDDGQHSSHYRVLKPKKSKKEKSKSSKGKSKKSSSIVGSNDTIAINDDGDDDDDDALLDILSSTRSCTHHSQCKGIGLDDRSSGCWMGSCTMCLPNKVCYCSSNSNVYVRHWPMHRPTEVSLVNVPRNAVERLAICHQCLSNLVSNRVLVRETQCDLKFNNAVSIESRRNVNVFDYFRNFGPPNVGDIGRERNACHFNEDRGNGQCRLFCGVYHTCRFGFPRCRDYRLHIDYSLTSGGGIRYENDTYDVFHPGTQVWGLPTFGGDWHRGCNMCGRNLERTGFIEQHWRCRHASGIISLNVRFRDGLNQ